MARSSFPVHQQGRTDLAAQPWAPTLALYGDPFHCYKGSQCDAAYNRFAAWIPVADDIDLQQPVSPGCTANYSQAQPFQKRRGIGTRTTCLKATRQHEVRLLAAVTKASWRDILGRWPGRGVASPAITRHSGTLFANWRTKIRQARSAYCSRLPAPYGGSSVTAQLSAVICSAVVSRLAQQRLATWRRPVAAGG